MGKTALITGATSGIGKEFSIRLGEIGYNLILVGRREKLLRNTADYIEKSFKVETKVCILDISSKEELENFLKEVDKYKNIEFLVNNAGHGANDSFVKDDIENQINMINVHIMASVRLCHLVANKMKENRKGYIINLSSLASFNTFPSSAMYCATKGFLTSFSQSLALELLDYNIRVQALCPGFVRTDFHSKLKMDESKLKNKGFVKWMVPKEVVRISLNNINKRLKVLVVPVFFNKILFAVSKFTPKFIYYKVALKGWKLLD